MENEVLIAENQVSGKRSTLWSQVSCHKDREEATPFIVFGKLSKCESSVRKQIFSVYELSQEIFLLFNFLLCSLMYETFITLQWCFSAHRDKDKAFWVVIFFWLYWVYFPYGHFSIWDKWGLLSACRVHGFSLRWLLLLWSTSSRHTHFSSFATQAQYRSFISLVAPWHVRSSQNKDRNHVSRISKLTFYHEATRALGKLNK